MIILGVTFVALVSTVLAGSNPPNGALVVGQGGTYKTVQQAVNAAKSGQTIFIKSGSYKEQVYIPKEKSKITIIGQSSSESSYKSNTVTITGNKAQDNPKGTNNDNTGVLRAHGDNFKLYNVNLVNTRGKGSQALALSAYGNKQGYYGCQFRGYQDTILSEQGEHLFANSLIEGATDFIFGQKAQSWFESVDIKVIAPGFITGKSRDIFSIGF
jgi:pectinesterase